MPVSPENLDDDLNPQATFLFADLCGYTEYTCRYGDERGTELATAFHRLVRELAAESGCDMVRSIGDAVMVRASSCRAAVRLAHRILELCARDGYPPVHMGLDTGPAVERDGDWYGTTVNAASRMADAAAPNELLVTDRARDEICDTRSIELITRGIRHLKGLPDSPVHAAVAAHARAGIGECGVP
jgi:adenylate cyclase